MDILSGVLFRAGLLSRVLFCALFGGLSVHQNLNGLCDGYDNMTIFFSSSIILNLKIASAPHDTHGDHLDDHFPKKVEVDHVIDDLGIVI